MKEIKKYLILLCIFTTSYYIYNNENYSKRLYMVQEENNEMEWMEKMKEIFALRKAHLNKQCQVLNESLNYSEPTDESLLRHIYMTNHYNLLICVVHKVASSTWGAHITRMNSNNRLASSMIPESELRSRMMSSNNKFLKVMNVRHPLLRLVSAYRDKYSEEGFYMTKVNTRVFEGLIDKHLPERSGYSNISFSEFLRIIVGEKKMSADANKHWQTFHKVCSPCTLPYDHILHLETHDEDLAYIFKMAGINDGNVDIRKHATSREDSESKYWSYYNKVDGDLIMEIYNIYKEDLQLFGYEIPQFLQNIIQNKM